ncbi:hypothetical protein L204_102195 [Cryptococcus depauperatus]|nr:hypothetical protein L204_04687 [Cryptococcus depauperatus CBS 7855]
MNDYGGKLAQINLATIRVLAAGLAGFNKPLTITSCVNVVGTAHLTENGADEITSVRSETENVLSEFTL